MKNLKEKNKDICTVLLFHCYSVQIASGMEYLSENNIVHEDLGAHNILVFEPDKVQVMGCDAYNSIKSQTITFFYQRCIAKYTKYVVNKELLLIITPYCKQFFNLN